MTSSVMDISSSSVKKITVQPELVEGPFHKYLSTTPQDDHDVGNKVFHTSMCNYCTTPYVIRLLHCYKMYVITA